MPENTSFGSVNATGILQPSSLIAISLQVALGVQQGPLKVTVVEVVQKLPLPSVFPLSVAVTV